MEPELSFSLDDESFSLPPGVGRPSADDLFEIRPPCVPLDAVPLLDDASGAVMGYRQDSGGVWFVWDLDGAIVESGELPLESPLLDPFDLVFGLAGLLRGIGRSVFTRATLRTATGSALRTGIRALSQRTLMLLHRPLSRLLTPGTLKFTATTAARMQQSGRGVPLHILHLAIRHGRQAADPQGAIGAIQYSIPMLRNGTQYTLKVIVRVRDSTILHFHYFR